MRKALNERIAFFADHGCCVSDHALDYCFCEDVDEAALNDIYTRAKASSAISVKEQNSYHTVLLQSVSR